MRKLGIISGTYYVLLTTLLIIVYIMLNRTLRKNFSNQAAKEILNSVNMFFGVLVVSYTLRTAFLFFQGHYYLFIKKYFVRMELELCVWPLFDFLAIIPIFLIHYKNYSYKKYQTPIARTSS